MVAVSARAPISQAQLAELHLLEAAYGGQSIIDYIPRISPVMPGGVRGVAPQHLLPLAQRIALAEYQPVRTCTSVPPRHGKTELIIHAIAWWLQRHPEQTVAYVSYSGDIAAGKSARARDLAVASGVQLGAMNRAHEWRTVQGGGVLATGIGGPLTGMGCNLLIIDDPIKNREEAESSTQRDKVWEWFVSTAMTRPTPTGSVIVNMTRWHPDDLIGRLIKQRSWPSVNLPAYDESLKTYLWPEGGWDARAMESRRAEVGEYDWQALYMGNPRPKGGRVFEEPLFYDKPSVIGSRIFMACDPAATAASHADYSVILVGACWIGPDGMPHVDVLDMWRGQVEIPRLVMTLKYFQEQYGCPVGIESQGSFKGVAQSLRQQVKGVRIIEIPALKDKFTRALPASAAWNGLPGQPHTKRIRMPRPDTKPWVNTMLAELGEFTGIGDVHDDIADALAHLYQMAATMLGGARRSSSAEIARYLPFG